MILDLQNICKSYGEGKYAVPILHDVCFQVEKGEYVSVMGPSGSGKSTLMNIIGCLDVPTSGTFTLDGHEIEKCSQDELSEIRNKTIGFVFQNFNLLPRETALENVALPMLYGKVGRKERLERAARALESVGLSERMDFYPTQLSGGQKQRVAIARAMVMNPPLLLADEPTGALDSASGVQVMELFQELNRQGVTIVMITHDPDVAAMAGRQVMIKDGVLKANHMKNQRVGDLID
ncbi:MAG: ABC transporter ATP-binding protein [Lachnospiraceae bacterium]|nr:ABC transporter ATP-binding protein [Lachnospiraceae bacterium]